MVAFGENQREGEYMAQGTGALPPKGVEWQVGKTAASIKFVNDAHMYIAHNTDVVLIGALTDAIRKINSGELVMTEWTTPHQYLKGMESGYF